MFEYLLAGALILETNSIWGSIPSLKGIAGPLFVLMLCGAICGGIVTWSGTTTKKQLLSVLLAEIIFLMYAVLYIFLQPVNNSEGYLKLIMIVLSLGAFQLIRGHGAKTLSVLFKYENLILLIAMISLFFWLFGSMLKLIHNTGFVYSSWTGTGANKLVPNYYNLYFETQYYGFFTRNTAIFTEAPMSSFHFSVALLIEFFLKKTNRKRAIILIIAILSTVSTTGYIAMSGALFAKYALGKTRLGRSIRVFIILITLVAVSCEIIYLFQLKMGTGSGSQRYDDFVAGYKAWQNNPFVGNGYGSRVHQKYMNSSRIDRGFSNSPMLILTYGGLYWFIPYLFLILRGLKNAALNKHLLCFYLIFCFMLIITIVAFKSLTLFLLISFAGKTELGRNSI